MRYYFKALGKYFSISGRASRKELWMFRLFDILFLFAFLMIDFSLGTTFPVDNGPNGSFTFGYIAIFYYLFTLIPFCTLQVRRLHDVNRSGLWWFVTHIPIICLYPLCLIFFAESNRYPNKYGEVPENVRGYAPNVYVNINMNQSGSDGSKQDTSYSYTDYEEEYNFYENNQHTEEKRQYNNVYEYAQDNRRDKSSPYSDSSTENQEDAPAAKTSEKEASPLFPILFVIAVFIIIIIFLFADFTKNESQTQKTNFAETKTESGLLGDKKIQAQVEEFLSDKNAGFGSEHFYTDTPFLRLNKTDDEVYLGIVRIYNTSYNIDVTGDSADIQWAEYYTGIYVSPKKEGITLVEFTNDLNDYSFQVMVLVE